MLFTSSFALLATALTAVNAAAVHQARGGVGVSPPPYKDIDSLPPRPDQTENVLCDIEQYTKTNNIPFTARDQSDGPYGYLYNLNGVAIQNAGPRVCTRVSCAWDLGVYFCNDNDHGIEVNWHDIAKYVNDIGMTCGGGVHLPGPFGPDPYGEDFFDFTKNEPHNGQKFSPDNWNIIINGDKC